MRFLHRCVGWQAVFEECHQHTQLLPHIAPRLCQQLRYLGIHLIPQWRHHHTALATGITHTDTAPLVTEVRMRMCRQYLFEQAQASPYIGDSQAIDTDIGITPAVERFAPEQCCHWLDPVGAVGVHNAISQRT
jgi:hypothetical protein